MTNDTTFNQVGYTPRRLIEYVDDYTLFLSTLSFCHGFRMGQTAITPEVIPMKISSLPSKKYRLKAPIDIILEKHPDEVLALLPELTLCGEGPNELEAIDDLRLDIIDLLDDLEGIPEAKLGANPKLWRQTLDLMVEECQ